MQTVASNSQKLCLIHDFSPCRTNWSVHARTSIYVSISCSCQSMRSIWEVGAGVTWDKRSQNMKGGGAAIVLDSVGGMCCKEIRKKQQTLSWRLTLTLSYGSSEEGDDHKSTKMSHNKLLRLFVFAANQIMSHVLNFRIVKLFIYLKRLTSCIMHNWTESLL